MNSKAAFKEISSKLYRDLLNNASSLQEKAIINMLTNEKIWPFALTQIRMEDLDLEAEKLFLTKSTVKLTDKTKELLAAYLETERSMLTEKAEAEGEHISTQLFLCLTCDDQIRPLDLKKLGALLRTVAERAGYYASSLNLFLVQFYIDATNDANIRCQEYHTENEPGIVSQVNDLIE